MHCSPLSKFHNKLLWEHYNYRNFGIIGEPYFDVDFSKVLYLADTGRRWNGEKVSIRDKVKMRKYESREDSPLGDQGVREGKVKIFRHTSDIISAIEKGFTCRRHGELPDQMMFTSRGWFTFHPQRWTDQPLPWAKELVWQNTKNVVKYFLNKIRT